MRDEGMRSRACLAGILLALHGLAVAADFTIEDQGLTTLPQEAENAIRARTGSEFTRCRIVGKPVDLNGKGPQSGYAATTAGACGWGASVGPVWVLVMAENDPRVVLSDRSYSLTVGKQQGMRNLATAAGTSAWYRETLWKYDGKVYRPVRSYNFTPDDTATCRAHPKVCPFK